jgi:hypothetical protein
MEDTYSEDCLLDHLLVWRMLRRGGLFSGGSLTGSGFGRHGDYFSICGWFEEKVVRRMGGACRFVGKRW